VLPLSNGKERLLSCKELGSLVAFVIINLTQPRKLEDILHQATSTGFPTSIFGVRKWESLSLKGGLIPK
jgi:hypothetical protein